MWPALNQIEGFLNFVVIFSKWKTTVISDITVQVMRAGGWEKKLESFTCCSIVHPLAICISRCYKSQLLSKSKKWYELTRCCGGAGHNCFMLWFRAHHSVVGQQTKAFEVLCQRNDMKSPDAVALPAIIVLEEESASCICFPAANWQSWNKCSSLLFLFSSWGY